MILNDDKYLWVCGLFVGIKNITCTNGMLMKDQGRSKVIVAKIFLM